MVRYLDIRYCTSQMCYYKHTWLQGKYQQFIVGYCKRPSWNECRVYRVTQTSKTLLIYTSCNIMKSEDSFYKKTVKHNIKHADIALVKVVPFWSLKTIPLTVKQRDKRSGVDLRMFLLFLPLSGTGHALCGWHFISHLWKGRPVSALF